MSMSPLQWDGESDALKKFYEAFIKVQSTGLIAIQESQNTHLNSRYANLVAVWKLIRPKLTEERIGVIQGDGLIRWEGGNAFKGLSTTLVHVEGARVSCYGEMPMAMVQKGLNVAQIAGLTISYHRRYQIMMMLGIVSGDDEDAQNAFPQTSVEPEESETGSETMSWQQLFETGKWRKVEVFGDAEMRAYGDLKPAELRPLVKANASSGGNNAVLTAASAAMLANAAKLRAPCLADALDLAKWKGPKTAVDLSPQDIILAYNAVIALPLKEDKGS